jgi:integrase/recombinase XerD
MVLLRNYSENKFGVVSFSCQIILSNYVKRDGTRAVYLQAIIDRKHAEVPLGFYLPDDAFDPVRQRVKGSYPNSSFFNLEFDQAKGRAANIASRYRLAGNILTPDSFRFEYKDPGEKFEFLDFFKRELDLRKPKVAVNTHRQHQTVLSKLKVFRKRIYFPDLTQEFIEKFENHLITVGNSKNTINKNFRIMKVYLHQAEKKGIRFKNPFKYIRMRAEPTTRVALSEDELAQLIKYYKSADCNPTHRHILRYFLFSCGSGIRISDVKQLTWNHIHGDTMKVTSKKTKGTVDVPLSNFERSLLPECTNPNSKIFNCFADAVTNRFLKKIAEKCAIKKNLTYHMSRHTFATYFLEKGGNVEVLQSLMDHSDIDTTMVYVHMTDKRKRTQKIRAFKKLGKE